MLVQGEGGLLALFKLLGWECCLLSYNSSNVAHTLDYAQHNHRAIAG